MSSSYVVYGDDWWVVVGEVLGSLTEGELMSEQLDVFLGLVPNARSLARSPLRYRLFTPELQWQSWGQRRISQGGGVQ
jgi:hypothetical protein